MPMEVPPIIPMPSIPLTSTPSHINCSPLAAPNIDPSLEPIKPEHSLGSQVIDLLDDSVVVPHCESDDVTTAFIGSSTDDDVIKTDQSNLVVLEKPRECLLFKLDIDFLLQTKLPAYLLQTILFWLFTLELCYKNLF